MSDIVERLRECHGINSGDPYCYCGEAADEIERLRTGNLVAADTLRSYEREIERLRGLLHSVVSALDSDVMQGVWSYLYAHGYNYTGPVIPMNEIRDYLNNLRAPEGK